MAIVRIGQRPPDLRLFILPLACLALAGLASQQVQVFRSSANAVAVYVTVKDANGRFVPDLERDSFEVLDDGRLTNIVLFSNEPQPLSVAIMLHLSHSASWGTADLRGAMLAFVDALQPDDRVSLGSFGIEIAVGANLTRDRREIARVLDEEMWHGGGSPLWQAIRAASSSLQRESGRRAVLIISRGNDSGELPGFEGGRSGAERQALADECMVYGVLFENNRDHEIGRELVSLTETVGGGHLVVPVGGDAPAAMRRVAEELRHQYLLGFVPAALDGKVHKVEVRLKDARLSATARRNYLARAPQ